MPKSKENDALFMDSHTEGAFGNMLNEMMLFVKALNGNAKISALNGELEASFSTIEEIEKNIQYQISQGKQIMPEGLKRFTNEMIHASELLHLNKIDCIKNKMAKDLLSLIPDLNHLDTNDDEKLAQALQMKILSTMEKIHMHAEKVRNSAKAKDMLSIEKLTQASEQFSRECRDKILTNLSR